VLFLSLQFKFFIRLFASIKVRMQTSQNPTKGIWHTFTEFGGASSLYRGISAPLYTAAFINAIIFGSYGLCSRMYCNYYYNNNKYGEQICDNITTSSIYEIQSPNKLEYKHDSWQKSLTCGAFAGFTQCFIKCPMEHVKCRLQTQHGRGSHDYIYKSPNEATRQILQQHGIRRLYQGFWATCFREVPSFAAYFASYDFIKDFTNDYIGTYKGLTHHTATANSNNFNIHDKIDNNEAHSLNWVASAFAGGCAGCLSWTIVYPIDVIKTRIQTSPLTTPFHNLSVYRVGKDIVRQHGVRYLFRGLGITLIRAFPVNATIFAVYEFSLKLVGQYIDER
jgi:Mitochondrial carrier protein